MRQQSSIDGQSETGLFVKDPHARSTKAGRTVARESRSSNRRSVTIEELHEEQLQSRIDVSVEIVRDNYATKRRLNSVASMEEQDDRAIDRSQSNV